MQIFGHWIHPWQLLMSVGVLCVIAEVFIGGFVLLPIGVGFLLTAFPSFWIQSWPITLLTLAFFQFAMFLIFKNSLKKFHGKTRVYTNMEGLVGSECIVTEAISSGKPGYVKLYGDRWQAFSENNESFSVGKKVVIIRLEGNKVYVESIH